MTKFTGSSKEPGLLSCLENLVDGMVLFFFLGPILSMFQYQSSYIDCELGGYSSPVFQALGELGHWYNSFRGRTLSEKIMFFLGQLTFSWIVLLLSISG